MFLLYLFVWLLNKLQLKSIKNVYFYFTKILNPFGHLTNVTIKYVIQASQLFGWNNSYCMFYLLLQRNKRKRFLKLIIE